MIPHRAIPITPERWATFRAASEGCRSMEDVAKFLGITKSTAADRVYSAKSVGLIDMEPLKHGTIRAAMKIVKVIE